MSCNKSKKEEVAEKVVKKELRPFFDSDKIDHYYLNFSENDFFKLVSKDNISEKEQQFLDIYEFNFPDVIAKKDFEKLLIKYKYKKSNLSIQQERGIENVFSEKDSLQNTLLLVLHNIGIFFFLRRKKKQ